MSTLFQAKLLLDRFPALYLALLRIKRRKHWSQKWVVGPNTEIAIEGFPRSGNSFAYSAFRKANPEAEVIATHVHMSAQIVMAARYGVPCMVLLREPAQAVCSLMAFSMQIGDRVESDTCNTLKHMTRLFQLYTTFYQRVLAVRNEVVWAPFDLVISDFGTIIEAVNKRYGCTFALFEQSEANVGEIFEDAPVHLGPRADRDRLKEPLLILAGGHEIKKYRARAKTVYQRCLEYAANSLE